MLGFARSVRVRAIRLGKRVLELRGDRRKIPFAKDYSYGRSSGHATTLRIGIIFSKSWVDACAIEQLNVVGQLQSNAFNRSHPTKFLTSF